MMNAVNAKTIAALCFSTAYQELCYIDKFSPNWAVFKGKNHTNTNCHSQGIWHDNFKKVEQHYYLQIDINCEAILPILLI